MATNYRPLDPYEDNHRGVGATLANAFGAAPAASKPDRWPEPKPLPAGLRPVQAFDRDLLPESIAPWVFDIADRMQCPPDFVAVPALVALGSVIGRKLAIRPQRRTDWCEVANLWGCIVGRPGAMKSPAISEALKPLHRAERAAREIYEAEAQEYALAMEAFKISKEGLTAKARAAVKNGGAIDPMDLAVNEPAEPVARRYVVNDTSYEALGEILASNPNGVLAFRDELVSLLKTLDREDYAAARGFFLTAWNGTSGYAFDRITRGRTHIDAACLSLLGGTQPGRIAEYIRRATGGGASDDGLIQRFGLLVWPDQTGEWEEIDRPPDRIARDAAWSVFDRLDKLEPADLGAETDEYQPLPFLRFDGDAQGLFAEWRATLEVRLRSAEMPPALESHLSKYKKLIPGLALISHLADGGAGPVNETATMRALAMAEYLESHAVRCYSAGTEAETAAAKAILARIRKGDLVDGFTAREVHQHGWANLSDREQVGAGLALLSDLDWIAAETQKTGGRSRTVYTINPAVHGVARHRGEA